MNFFGTDKWIDVCNQNFNHVKLSFKVVLNSIQIYLGDKLRFTKVRSDNHLYLLYKLKATLGQEYNALINAPFKNNYNNMIYWVFIQVVSSHLSNPSIQSSLAGLGEFPWELKLTSKSEQKLKKKLELFTQALNKRILY